MSELRLVVDIPFAPPQAASPNSRVHWRKRYEETRTYREAAALATSSALFDAPTTAQWYLVRDPAWEFSVAWTIYLPKRGKQRDDDNALASTKGARDGIADALGVDDRRFCTIAPVRQERDPEGRGRTVAVVTARRKDEG